MDVFFHFCWAYVVCNKLHCVSKKVPTFELSVTLSNYNRYSKFLYCWKAYEVCYKPMRHYPPPLRHVATIPWEIKHLNFLQIFSRYGRNANKLHFNSSNFVIHPQILIFSVFKIANLSPYWLQIKFLSKSCPRRWIPCWLLTDTAVASVVTNFRCHKLVAKVIK